MSDFRTHGGYFAPAGYMKVEAGGSHAENPNGGVQIGMDQQGIPNLLEEGEPVYNDYVFSDNIKANESTLKKLNLPTKYAGMLYSEIADKFMDEAGERPNDPISNRGLEAMLNRLADAQEEQKAKAEERRLAKEISNMSPEEQAVLADAVAQQQGAQPMSQEQVPVEMPVQETIPGAPLMACFGGKINRFATGGPFTNLVGNVRAGAAPLYDYRATSYAVPSFAGFGGGAFGGAGAYGSFDGGVPLYEFDYVENIPLVSETTFSEAYDAARKAGLKNFQFNGETYTTDYDPNAKPKGKKVERAAINLRNVYDAEGKMIPDSTRIEPYVGQIPGRVKRTFEGGGPTGEGKGFIYMPGYDNGTELDLYSRLEPSKVVAYPGKTQAWVDAQIHPFRRGVTQAINNAGETLYPYVAGAATGGAPGAVAAMVGEAVNTGVNAATKGEKNSWGELLVDPEKHPVGNFAAEMSNPGYLAAGMLEAPFIGDIKRAFAKEDPEHIFKSIGKEAAKEVAENEKGRAISKAYTEALTTRDNLADSISTLEKTINDNTEVLKNMRSQLKEAYTKVSEAATSKSRKAAEKELAKLKDKYTQIYNDLQSKKANLSKLNAEKKSADKVFNSAKKKSDKFYGVKDETPAETAPVESPAPVETPATNTGAPAPADTPKQKKVEWGKLLGHALWDPTAVWRFTHPGKSIPGWVAKSAAGTAHDIALGAGAIKEAIPWAVGELKREVPVNEMYDPNEGREVVIVPTHANGGQLVHKYKDGTDNIATKLRETLGLSPLGIDKVSTEPFFKIDPKLLFATKASTDTFKVPDVVGSSADALGRPLPQVVYDRTPSLLGELDLTEPVQREEVAENKSTFPGVLPTVGRYATGLGSLNRMLHNIVTPPTRLQVGTVTPSFISGNYRYQPVSNSFIDPNLTTNVLLADAARQGRLAANSGYGPSAGIIQRAAYAPVANAIGQAMIQTALANEQSNNNAIAQNNAGYAQQAAFQQGIDAANAPAAMNAAVRNIQNDITRQRFNDAIESSQFAAISNEQHNIEDVLERMAIENQRLNMLRSNPTLYQHAGINGYNVYRGANMGGTLLKKHRK